MFGIGWSEFIVIALVMLIFVGPKHLPVVLRKVGKVIGDLKRASIELQSRVSEEVRDIERSIGDAKPKIILRDLEQDLRENLKDPYDDIGKDIKNTFKDPHTGKDPYEEVRDAERAYQEELAGIQKKMDDPLRLEYVADKSDAVESVSKTPEKDKGKGR